MKELRTEIEINAPAMRVWEIITDFESFPQWNPFIRRVAGKPEVGQKLEAFIQPSGASGMTFRPTVLVAEPGRELRWRGRLLLPGIFDGEHIFQIEPLHNGSVRFVHREEFNGLLVPIFWKQVDRDTRRGFNEMNLALKELAETTSD